MTNDNRKNVLYATLAAVGLTLAHSLLLSGSFLIWLTPVAIAALYAWGGIIPACVLSAGSVLMMVSLGNALPELAGIQAVNPMLMAAGTLLVLVLPAAAVIVSMEKKMPFARRAAVGVGTQTAALLLGAGLVYLGTGADVIGVLTGLLRGMVDTLLPPDMALEFLRMFSAMGLLTKETVSDLKTLLEQFERIDPMQLYSMGYTLSAEQMQMLVGALDQAFEYFTYYLRQIMPALLLHSGLVTGVVMTAFSSWVAKRQNEECETDHVPVVKWQVPRQAMGMMLLGMLTGLAMQYMQTSSALAVTSVFSMLLTALLTMQGLAALLRMFQKSGVSRGFRIGVTAAILVLAASVLETVGAMSALFGSEGVVTKWMKKRMEESRKEDDE